MSMRYEYLTNPYLLQPAPFSRTITYSGSVIAGPLALAYMDFARVDFEGITRSHSLDIYTKTDEFCVVCNHLTTHQGYFVTFQSSAPFEFAPTHIREIEGLNCSPQMASFSNGVRVINVISSPDPDSALIPLLYFSCTPLMNAFTPSRLWSLYADFTLRYAGFMNATAYKNHHAFISSGVPNMYPQALTALQTYSSAGYIIRDNADELPIDTHSVCNGACRLLRYLNDPTVFRFTFRPPTDDNPSNYPSMAWNLSGLECGKSIQDGFYHSFAYFLF